VNNIDFRMHGATKKKQCNLAYRRSCLKYSPVGNKNSARKNWLKMDIVKLILCELVVWIFISNFMWLQIAIESDVPLKLLTELVISHTYTDLVPAVLIDLNTVGETGWWCLLEYCMCVIRECFINWLCYVAGKQEFLCI
jgi:hypothetical protein